MKTLKFLVALIFVLGFTFNKINAQVHKSVYIQDWSFDLPCLGEIISGSPTLVNFSWEGRSLVKLDGILIGQTTRKEYTISYNWRYITIPLSEDYDISPKWTETMMVRYEGKLVAIIHWNWLYTMNDNGDVICKVDHYTYDCK